MSLRSFPMQHVILLTYWRMLSLWAHGVYSNALLTSILTYEWEVQRAEVTDPKTHFFLNVLCTICTLCFDISLHKSGSRSYMNVKCGLTLRENVQYNGKANFASHSFDCSNICRHPAWLKWRCLLCSRRMPIVSFGSGLGQCRRSRGNKEVRSFLFLFTYFLTVVMSRALSRGQQLPVLHLRRRAGEVLRILHLRGVRRKLQKLLLRRKIVSWYSQCLRNKVVQSLS